MSEIVLDSAFVNVKASTIVKLNECLTLYTDKKPINLTVDITVDLASIPQEYHEVFMNMIMAKYLNKVSFGHNPFSQCVPAPRKWWEFWAGWF